MTQNWLQYAILFAILYAVLLGIRLRRESIRYTLGRFAGLAFAGWLVISISQQKGWPQENSVVAGVVAAVVVDQFIPKRSRHIRKQERRRAIARFEVETRERYNPKLHDLDHTVPFSKGGSSTADNLRVTTRRKNRSKGAKSPWWDPFG
jgi:hypothetical protein